MELKKRVTRYGNIVRAEIYRLQKDEIFTYKEIFNEIYIASKEFNSFYGMFGFDPTDEDYQKANQWADNAIEMEQRNTK